MIMGTIAIRCVLTERRPGRREHSEGLSGDFRGVFLDIVENAKISRRFQIFVLSGLVGIILGLGDLISE